MNDIAVFEAKNRLSELLRRVESGEEFAITRRGEVVARLVPARRAGADESAEAAIAALRRARRGVSLGGLAARDLIREGRR